jgi:lipase maturation factor
VRERPHSELGSARNITGCGIAGGTQTRLSQTFDLRDSYWFSRVLFFRFLGLIYFLGFFSLSRQLGPLLGETGLLPACAYVERLDLAAGGRLSAFLVEPSIFLARCSDALLYGLAYAGVALSLLLVAGCANVPLLALLWFLYMSFCHVGQIFYAYGWEILLLETGFLAIFLCPLVDVRPFPTRAPPSMVVMWLLRWVLFRVMLGAGLIKLRGDPCWRDLTCMLYHYETQPLPNPLSWYLHQLPPAFHKLEVLGNHFVELMVPWTLFAPRRLRHIGGVFLVGFQVYLIFSGNLSWLNWLTLTLCIPCFDDAALARLIPRRLRARLSELRAARASLARRVTTSALAALVIYLSIGPVRNLMGARQAMNASFDPLHLVNTYGAFGSIGKRRQEVILQGTYDQTVTESTQWLEYEFKCKPGDVYRRPCVVSPYHYRLDWQIWFAAMEDYRSNPWLVRLVAKLLAGDAGAASLLATNPFERGPPKFIRAELYEYRFTRFGDPTGAWWTRTRLGPYLSPLSLETPALRRFLQASD